MTNRQNINKLLVYDDVRPKVTETLEMHISHVDKERLQCSPEYIIIYLKPDVKYKNALNSLFKKLTKIPIKITFELGLSYTFLFAIDFPMKNFIIGALLSEQNIIISKNNAITEDELLKSIDNNINKDNLTADFSKLYSASKVRLCTCYNLPD